MKMYNLIMALVVTLAAVSCRNDELEEIVTENDDEVVEVEIETPDWTESTHSNQVDPNYSVVFPDDKVLRLDITLSSENWSSMQSDLAVNLGNSGGPGGGPGGADLDFTPIWVPCTIEFEGKEWYKAGIRYKGNSSLQNAYRSNSDKYPFKLDFDEFEDNYPAIKNQRFYGFKQLNLSNNFDDRSFMKEKVAADLFREFGVPAARTAFVAVYLKRSGGSEFLGMYTLVEEVDDSVIETQFADDKGNLYKPDGTAASFAQGSYNTSDMDKKSNEDENDFSDVRALYDVLHNSNRTNNSTQWQSDLEEVFDVDHFLKYLAANNVIQNWDTYGNMTHNYFLYNNEGKLTWIPWDNNEAFQVGKMGGAISLSTSEVGSDWPIIRYIMDVPSYESAYRSYLKDFTSEVYEPSRMSTLLDTYQNLIDSYASQEYSSFGSYVQSLKSHVSARQQAVNAFIN